MTKAELVKNIAEKTDSYRADIERILQVQADILSAELLDKGLLTLPGIGIFKVQQNAARTGRNPKTGEVLQIPAKKKVVFKAVLDLRSAINK